MLLTGFMIPATAQETQPFKTFKMNVQEKDFGNLGISSPEKLPVSSGGSLVEVDSFTVAGISKSYDRQTQNAVYPMTKMHDDGYFIGCTWTNEDNISFIEGSKRGVGYSYSTDGGLTWSAQENRIGGIPLYCPSYAQWGANGEAVLARSSDSYLYNGIQILKGLVLMTRETRGEGEWKISPVPYPAGITPSNDCFMAWARMTTSGENNEYIHIMSPMLLHNGQPYKGYYTPTLYYRTQDGGFTWDYKAELVPEMTGQDWGPHSQYLDGITFAVQNNTVVAAFIAIGNNGYVVRSLDNGENWESIMFFDSPVKRDSSPSQYADTVYIPTQGCIALDMNGKAHIAFTVQLAKNIEDEGFIGYFPGTWQSSFLTYWNEYMEPIDGSADFVRSEIYPILYDYFDWNLSNKECLYVKSTVPKLPIIGYFFAKEGICFPWDSEAGYYYNNCYCIGDIFSFPQMAFDMNNGLHLVYLGIVGVGFDDDTYFHHPFTTTTYDMGETWSQTEHLINNVDLIDKEFAYITLAGIRNWKDMYLMAQVDSHPGTYIGSTCQSSPTDNSFVHFVIKEFPPYIEDLTETRLIKSITPNPASGHVTVKFDGKATLTVYNMLGQTVYHVENVENEKVIPLNNLTTGVYFVKVQAGYRMATQKLVVR